MAGSPMQKFLRRALLMKIAQQLLEAVLQFMNASAMTQVLTLIFLALIIQVLKTLITAWIVRKPSSGEMVLDRKPDSAGRKDHCRQLSQHRKKHG
ncbi:hypothetical protein XL89_19490 [Salmonella enterica subsp. enterica]|uniref:Uncharacterized protein n=2 Tax=Salmonella enterica TaxID=28901 RepID=A0A3Y8PK58_SALVI|nr:hypothetical protein [Salmonella enterica subsp. enterica serovar Virchow]EBZ9809050.1 hypothetical protein [Salmonella enterica subsp. enterica serovar Virchow]EEG1672061.1 hypothetical protein [Salmonella enterica subsp. enterica serovar Virchow]HAF0512443.1 hypothetical protein [Salmonella enterica subsp. enterica serovar Virchow]